MGLCNLYICLGWGSNLPMPHDLGIKSFPILWNRCKNSLVPTPLIYMCLGWGYNLPMPHYLCVRTLPLLWSRCKNRPAPMFCDLPVFRFRIEFASCFFTMGFKPIGVGHSQNVRLDLAIVLSPLFWECPHVGSFPYKERPQIFLVYLESVL
jgi:hypothetical protein